MKPVTTDGASKLKVVVPPNQTFRETNLLALEPLSLFAKPQGQRLINSLSLHKLDHFPSMISLLIRWVQYL